MERYYESRRPNRLDRSGLFVMIDVVKDIEILEEALIGIKEGASDEKRMAISSLENLLQRKKNVLREFESQAPGYQFEMEFMYESV